MITISFSAHIARPCPKPLDIIEAMLPILAMISRAWEDNANELSAQYELNNL